VVPVYRNPALYNWNGGSFSGELDVRQAVRTVTVSWIYSVSESTCAAHANGSTWPSYGSHKVGVDDVIRGTYFRGTKITIV
jgi:hypothetical protein